MNHIDLSQYTSAKLRMESVIDYDGHTADQVFGIMGDPERITDWYLLARTVKMHPCEEGEEQTFNVEFTFFGDVYEEILYWDPPRRYIYQARGDEFPIRDYVAVIEVATRNGTSGTRNGMENGQRAD